MRSKREAKDQRVECGWRRSGLGPFSLFCTTGGLSGWIRIGVYQSAWVHGEPVSLMHFRISASLVFFAIWSPENRRGRSAALAPLLSALRFSAFSELPAALNQSDGTLQTWWQSLRRSGSLVANFATFRHACLCCTALQTCTFSEMSPPIQAASCDFRLLAPHRDAPLALGCLALSAPCIGHGFLFADIFASPHTLLPSSLLCHGSRPRRR